MAVCILGFLCDFVKLCTLLLYMLVNVEVVLQVLLYSSLALEALLDPVN